MDEGEKRAKDIQLLEDVAECLGMALYETLRVAIYAAIYPRSNTEFHRAEKDTGNLREAWRNLAGKIYDYAEPE